MKEIESKIEVEGHTLKPVLLDSNEKTNFNEDLAADMIGRNFYVRIYMICVWLAASGVMIIFLYNIAAQYIQGKSVPSSSISISTVDSVPIPKVVVCNWNQDGSLQDPTPAHNCSECLLHLESCINMNTTLDCTQDWAHTPIQTVAGLFDCYTYNGDYYHAKYSATTGYSGSIATVWGSYLFPGEVPPLSRGGAQVSFLLLDGSSTDPMVIYNEIRYAAVGIDSFFSLTYVTTLHTELDIQPGTPANSSRYDTVGSTISLNAPVNETYSYIGISFAFQVLSVQTDLFFTSYTLQNFWGDFAGMIGTLMGLDVIKVASSLPLVWVASKIRSINPIEDHFNG